MDIKVDAAVREKLPELVEVLVEKKGVVDELASTLTINEIEQFAGEMEALGKEYGYPPLVSWGEELAQSAGSFDMDAMAKGLEGYPNLIDAVRAARA